MSSPIQNKIDLTGGFVSRKTEQPTQALVFAETAWQSWAHDTVMWHTNDIMTKLDAVGQLM